VTSYFYCNYGSSGGNSAIAVFRGILDQLLDQYPLLLPYCHTRQSTSGEPSLRSLTLAKKLLDDFCLTIPKLYIIVDGLDECGKSPIADSCSEAYANHAFALQTYKIGKWY
jgi:hypothetical protein